MNNNQVATVARILFALCLLVFAFLHFTKAEGMAHMVPAFLPGDAIWVYISAIALALAAVAFIINQKVKLAGYLLGAMFLIFVLTIHLPHAINSGNLAMVLKDTAMAAASFFIGSKS